MLSYLAAGDGNDLRADDYSRAALLDFLTPDEVIRAAIRDRHSRRTTFRNQDGAADDDYFFSKKRVKKLLVDSAEEYDGGLSYYNVYKPNSAAKPKYAGPFLSKSAPDGVQAADHAKLLNKWKMCP